MTLLRNYALLALASASLLPAADAKFSDPGQLVFSEAFSGPTLGPGWIGKPGKWEMVDGAAKVSEVPEDKHAAVRRHPVAYHDAIIQLAFEFDGARMVALSLNNKGGHVCRLIVTPKTMVLQVDQPNAKSDLKPVRLANANLTIEPGKWHTATLEVHGPTMIAQVDNNPPISGENPRVDVDKTDVGIPVAGVSAKVKDLKVYGLK